MSTIASGMTAEQFWQWCCQPANSGKRVELVRGEIIEMPPPGEFHGLLCGWIAHLLWAYVLQRGTGGVATNDTGLLVEQGPDTVRGPDLMLFTESRTLLEQASRRHTTRVPQLVVEVLSPSDRWSELLRRVGQYLRRGVPLVWVVDADARTVAVFRPGENQQLVEEDGELTGNDVLPGLRLQVAEVFRLPGTGAREPAT